MLLSLALTSFEKTLNHYLSLDPESRKRLELLDGKIIMLEFQHFPLKTYWVFNKASIHLTDQCSTPPDVTLCGTAFDYLRLSLSKSSSAALFASNIKIVGDVEIAQQFKALFAQLDIDWEEQLSHFTGDVVAYQIGNIIRNLSNWAKESIDSFRQDLTEYIQEETRLLPTRSEIEYFFSTVEKLRDDTDRLTFRITKLEKEMLL